MTSGLTNELMSRLSDYITSQMGLHYPPNRWVDLERGLQAVAGQFGCADVTSCAELLLRSFPLPKKSVEILATALTIGETYFFREKRSFDLLTESILPKLIASRALHHRRLRIWSAGCCTGEEPYSLAIVLDRLLPDWDNWNITILATDMNPLFLQKAMEGIYTDWSFRSAPPWLKTNYFRELDNHRFEILPKIKKRVAFHPLNLAEDIYPSPTNNTNAMDLIFCRNVLLYFKEEGIKRVAQNFHHCLVEKGCLFVSPAETSPEIFSQFSSVLVSDAQYYQKGKPPSKTDPIDPQLIMGIPEAAWPVDSIAYDPAPSFVSPTPDPTPSFPSDPVPVNAYAAALRAFEQGDYLKASETLKAELGKAEVSAESLALMARICANLGHLVEAQLWVEKAIKANRLNPELQYLRAIILQEQGSVEEGAVCLRRAIYLDPTFILAHFALGNGAVQQKNFREADKHFANVLSLLTSYQPNDLLPLSEGLVAGRLKEMVESARLIDRSL